MPQKTSNTTIQFQQDLENELKSLQKSFNDKEADSHLRNLEKMIADIINRLNTLDELVGQFRRLNQGEKGEDGYVPIKEKDYFDGEDGYTPVKGIDYFDGDDGADGKDGINGKDGKDGEDGISSSKTEIITEVTKRIPKPKDGKDGSPDTGEQIANKLEKLEGEKKLDYNVLKNRPDIHQLVAGLRTSMGGGGGGDTVRVEDVSSQVNGNRVFTLPLAARILWLQSSQAPGIFRPTIDFTSVATASNETTITLNETVDPITAGQSLLVLYVAS